MRMRMVLAVGLLAATAAAHDLYLVVEGEGAKRRVCARIGEKFPESENAIKLERIGDFRLTVDRVSHRISGEVDDAKKQTCAFLRNGDRAGGIADLTSQPNFIELPAKDFNAYLEGEGFTRIMELRKRSGSSEAPGREMYSRYAKVILPATENAAAVLEHELEIVPLVAPSRLKAGESLPVRIIFRGKPLAGVRVSAMYAGAHVQGHSFPVNAVTDAKGEARLKLDRAGLWYARLIFMLPKSEAGGQIMMGFVTPDGKKSAVPEYDWRSYFATLTFEVPREKAAAMFHTISVGSALHSPTLRQKKPQSSGRS